jgi:serine/threonine-protein kinase
MSNPSLPEIGDVIAGKYRIEKVVGEGGMGIVFAAHHLMLDQQVAVKVLLVDIANGEEIVERFVREAQAAARVKSDHVVRVMDAGSLESGLPFLVMEYLEGCDLDEVLVKEGPLEPTQLCDYMLQILAALAQAHAAGIVHRDLKPANIFRRTPDGGPELVKILDFGISKQESNRAGWKQLTGQTCLGTPAYMSPEQLRSSKNVDARADLWSLGVMMYELLTKTLPFDGESPSEIFAAVLEKTPAPIASLRRGVPDALIRIIDRALQKNPDDRFEDAGELALALAPLASGKWEHLVDDTNRSVARIRKAPASSGSALVAAAILAANTARPPPVGPETPLAFDVGRTLDEVVLAPTIVSTPAPASRPTPAVVGVAKRTVRKQRPVVQKKWDVLMFTMAMAAAPAAALLGMDAHARVNATGGDPVASTEITQPAKPTAAPGPVAEAPPAANADRSSTTSATKSPTKQLKSKTSSAASSSKKPKVPTYVEWSSRD